MEEDSVKLLREQVQALESELALTQASLTNTQNELTNTQNELSRLQRLYNRLNTHYEGLTKDYESVSQRLHGYKQAELSRVEIGTQTDPVCCEGDDKTTEAPQFPESSATNDDSASTEFPDSNLKKEEQSSESLADGLRSAAEAALGQTGFVFDERTGLYYDYSSGYYYDAEQGLYFDYQTGTYFYYDAEQQEYKFHSQVDMETYRARQQKLESAKTGTRTSEVAESSLQKKKKSKKRKLEKSKEEKKLPVKDNKKTEGDDEVEQKTGEDADSQHQMDHDGETKGQRSDMPIIPSATKPNRKQRRKLKFQSKSGDKNGVTIGEDLGNNQLERDDISRGEGSGDIEDKEDEDAEEAGQKSDAESTDTERSESDLEDGECSDSSDDESESDMEVSEDQDLSSRQWPSCIRVMVTSSDSLDVGSLFIITYTGATIGREKDMGHTIRIPDLQTSKMHAEVTYKEETRQYFIKDHASQNGTFVNDVRITEAKVMGEPYPLTHGDRIVIGGTHMLFHIHPGSDTCDECEPGQVQAKVQKDKLSDVVVMTKKQREAQRRKELKNIKKKFGLANTAYVDNSAAIKNPAYQDRTAERQRTVGSDNPYQKDDAPASVHRAIPAQNKGHKLLQKLGWKEGDSLGKDQTGRKEPIKIQIRTKQTAGLGSASGLAVSDIESVSATSKWVKAQERFENINNENASSSGKATGWVQGQTLQPGHEDS